MLLAKIYRILDINMLLVSYRILVINKLLV